MWKWPTPLKRKSALALVGTLIALLTPLATAQRASALSGYIYGYSKPFGDGSCYYRVKLTSSGADVSISDRYSHYYWAGGSMFSYTNGAILPSPAITANVLQNRCRFSNITNLAVDGANGTYATDDAIFLTFEATLPKGRYAYDFGLYGATGTISHETQTLLDAAPTVTISGLSPNIQGRQTVNVTFSEPVTGFTESDLSISNGTVVPGSLVATGQTTYKFDLRPNPGIVSVGIPAKRVTDTGSYALPNIGSNVLWATASAPDPITARAVVAKRYLLSSPGYTDFKDQSVATTGEVITSRIWDFGDGTTSTEKNPYHIYGSFGTFDVSLTVCDPVGCDTTRTTIVIDRKLSVMTTRLQGFSGNVSGPQTVTVTFSTAVNPSISGGLTLSDFTATNLTLENLTELGSGATSYGEQSWTLTATPNGPGAISLTLPMGSVANMAGVGNKASNTLSGNSNTGPIADAGPDQSVASGAHVTLDGSRSSDPDAGDTLSYAWTQTSGPAVILSSNSEISPAFTAPTVTAGDPPVTMVFRLTVTDSLGATSTANTSVTVEGPPSVVISNVPASFDGPMNFDMTITFSKPVTGFTATDIQVTGGSVNTLTGGPSAYVASITTSGKGNFTATVPAGVAQDAVGNGNLVSNAVAATNEIVANTRRAIGGFMQQQTSNILATAPDFGSFLSDNSEFATRNLNVAATPKNMNLSFRGSLIARESSKNYTGKTDIWAQIRAVRSTSGTAVSESFVGWLGVHRFLSRDFLVGAVLVADLTSASNSASPASGSGRGFMIGPYVAGKLGKSDLRFDAEYLWGKAFNRVSPLGTYTDRYTAQRRMVRVRISDSMTRGTWTISPNISLSHFSARQPAYTDGLGNLIPAQSLTIGEFRAGPEFARDFQTGRGGIVHAKFGFSAITNFNVTQVAGTPFLLGNRTLRARLDIGLSTTAASGWELSGSGFYDGLGIAGYHSYGATLRAYFRF